MGKNTKISWTDHSLNLWWGCTKIHTGCKNCYAENFSKRFGDDIWGENKKRKFIKSTFNWLSRFQFNAKKEEKKVKVFIGSMMDIFEESKPIKEKPLLTTGLIREKLFTEIKKGLYPNIIFLFLTKRPENIGKYLPIEWLINKPPDNVWIGVSVSDMETFKDTEWKLLNTGWFGNTFLSIEPQIELICDIDLSNIDWIIQGGESGPCRRPFDLKWAKIMKEMCKEQDVPYFFKQIDKVKKVSKQFDIKEYPKF